MKYVASNLGMPRIGRKRELKFAIEKYWRNEVSHTDLLGTAKEVVALNYSLQKEAGIGQIPVNDFTCYDRMLDMCCLTSLTPSRFNGLDAKSFTDSYFRFARGEGSVPAMEMTKWFDTNYHYIVPEIEESSSSSFNKEFFENQILPEGKKIDQKFTIIGPLTFLTLAKASKEGTNKYQIYSELKSTYDDLLNYVVSQGFSNLQIEEPALGTDLSSEQQELFKDFYSDLKTRTEIEAHILLTTYFGNVEGNIALAKDAEVDCIHLDIFTDESNLSNLSLLNESFESISLGVMSGRNIWKINLNEAIAAVNKAVDGLNFKTVFIAPTTSLQHVPYSLTLERKMPSEVMDWLAFAEEKIAELEILVGRLNNEIPETDRRVQAILRSNAARVSSTLVNNPAVATRLARLSTKDYERKTPFSNRQEIQQSHFNFPQLPTTTIGSFPQTQEIRKARADFTAGRMNDIEYKGFMEQAIVECIEKQEALGIDVLVHGEPERNDMVQYFGELLSGFTFTSFGWVQSYGTRCVKPPVIYGDVERPKAMTVEWAKFAQANTSKKMKGMLTGPVTILQWSFVRDDQPRSVTCNQIALAIRDEVIDLEEAGIDVIQVDEAAIREGLPIRKSKQLEYLQWSVDAFRLTTAGVEDQTQIHTHMCYSEFNDVMDSIAAMDADVISIECSRSNMELLNLFKQEKYPNEIGPGVWDIHSPRVPTLEELEQLIQKAVDVIDIKNLWINPDCGLKTRGWPEVEATLENMIKATENVRAKI
jgi:5-methyltetrahydropteroyltriglutamate--homocysteine methyltransferase